jgi:hypothetical protein
VTVDEAEAHLRQMLLDAGFDLNHPSPALAWEVFKGFVAVPVESVGGRTCEEVWFEACDGRWKQGWPGYFDFVRQFLQDSEGGAEFHEQITAHFTCAPDVQLGIGEGSTRWVDLGDLPASFRQVEESAAFKAGARFTRWAFEVRIDAC